jgi:hypothetical protein
MGHPVSDQEVRLKKSRPKLHPAIEIIADPARLGARDLSHPMS